MKKVLLAVLFITLGMAFTSNAYSQDLKVKVSNNSELVKALENPDVTSIVITQDGYYDAISNSVTAGMVICKNIGETKGALTCNATYSVTDVCFDENPKANMATVSNDGPPSCPAQPSTGWTSWTDNASIGWSWTPASGQTTSDFYFTGSTITDPYNYEGHFEATKAGIYNIQYRWSATTRAQFDVYFYSVPEVTIDNEIEACGQYSFDWEYDFGTTIGVNTTVTMTIEDSDGNIVDITPTSTFTHGDKGNIVFIPSGDMNECGSYTLMVSTTNQTGCGLDVPYTFYIYDTPVITDLTTVSEQCMSSSPTTLKASYTIECTNTITPTVGWVSSRDGTWTGQATNEATFLPTDGCGKYTFTYTVKNEECESFITHDIFYYDTPDVSIINTPTEECMSTTPTELTGSYSVTCDNSVTPTTAWTVTPELTGDVFNVNGNTATFLPEACGPYTFTYTVTNGSCVSSTTHNIYYYDTPIDVEIDAPTEECMSTTPTELTGSYSVTCDNNVSPTIEWTVIPTTGTLTPDGNYATFLPTVCGKYTFTYTVTNEECVSSTTHDIYYYDTPVVSTSGDNEVCGDVVLLQGSYTHSCDNNVTPTVQWSKLSGTGDVTFDPVAANVDDVEITISAPSTVADYYCGEYVFKYTVTNGSCESSTLHTVYFYDEPITSLVADPAVCGNGTTLTGSYTVGCDNSTTPTVVWATTSAPANAPTPTFTPINNDPSVVTVTTDADFCGEYTFTYTVNNDLCSTVTSTTVDFYATPAPVITPTENPYACSTVTYTATNDVCGGDDGVTFEWTVLNGETVTSTTNDVNQVTIKWGNDSTLTTGLSVNAYITALGNDCFGEDDLEELTLLIPTIEGQVRYWNSAETFMPTPFPTDNYSTYPEDYFYVTLKSDDLTSGGPGTYTVQPFLAEIDGNLVDYMSYYAFKLPVAQTGCMTDFTVEIYDGGLTYHSDVGTTPTPPEEEKILGASYTYNNWGGVNATDALAMQYMVGGNEQINVNPWEYTWVGDKDDAPIYGYYSNSIADVNSSVNGISALDALIANYRSVGLLGSYPNAATSYDVQFNPNFRVTGRLVDGLDEDGETWPTPFSNSNDEDVPFIHSHADYEYFSLAASQYYKSDKFDWKADKNYMNIYYEAIGDVNASYIPTSNGFKAQPNMELVYEGIVGTTIDSEMTIPVSIDRDAELGAITLSFTYRNDLIEVIGTNYADDNMFINQEEGILNIGWFSTESIEIDEDATVAQIRVRVIAEIPENTELFELGANTELADATATPIDVNLKTIGVTTDKGALAGAELVSSSYPNPFKTATTINYTLPESGNVKVEVYNNMGVLITILVEETQESGIHSVVFDKPVEGGVYYYSISVVGATDKYSVVKSIIVID